MNENREQVAPAKLDIFLLQDLTGTFSDDIDTVKTLVPNLVTSLRERVPDTNFGLGTFIDKPIAPFGSSADEYVYRTDLAITDSVDRFQSVVDGLQTQIGGDLPEAQLEGLQQVLLRASTREIGFRRDALRVVVLTTDDVYHLAGDGAAELDAEGNPLIPTPNNGDAVLDGDPPGTGEDYPSIEQVRSLFSQANITPIFAIAPNNDPSVDNIRIYEDLVRQLRVGNVVELSPDSSNIIDVILEGLNEISFVTVEDVSVREGNSGTRAATFTVNLSQRLSVPVTVSYETVDGTASSRQPDYRSTTGRVTFRPGQTRQTVTVNIVGDTRSEISDTILLNLSNPVNAAIADPEAVLTITNDDPAPPSLSINNVTVNERNSGFTRAVVNLRLNRPSTEDIQVRYATAPGTAISPNDYRSTRGLVTFEAGETNKTITVDVKGDVIPEPTESFFVNLIRAGDNYEIVNEAARINIPNDDGPFANMSISDAVVVEGDRGTTSARFTVSLSKPSAGEITVDYITTNGTARVGRDFRLTNGTLEFNRGERTKTIDVPIIGDSRVESDKTFSVKLTSPYLVNLVDNVAQGLIIDNDVPAISIDNAVRIVERDSGFQGVQLTVSMSAISDERVTLRYTTANGSARSGQDFRPSRGTITFNPGQRTQNILVSVRGDQVVEGNEDFSVRLSNAVNGEIRNGVATVRIEDNDVPDISIDDVRIVEGNRGSKQAVFKVNLSDAPFFPVRVRYATDNGSARTPDDYTRKSGTLTFGRGQKTKTITVPVKGDTLFERNETFSVSLSGATGGNLVDSRATATIVNDDRRSSRSIDNLFAQMNTFASEYSSTNFDSDISSLFGMLSDRFQSDETPSILPLPIVADSSFLG